MTATHTATRPSSSHTGHAHPATKAGRAACRRAMRGPIGATFAQPTKDTWPMRIDEAIGHTVYLTRTATKTGFRFTTTAAGVEGKPGYATTVKGSDWFSSSPISYTETTVREA